MDLRQLRRLVADIELTQMEFKRSTGQRSDAAKTVCAMLNVQGGYVCFGVADSGEIVGQEVASDTLAKVAHELRKIEPAVSVGIETVDVDAHKKVIVLSVPRGGGPYTYDSRPYVRVASTTVQMPQEQYARQLMERMHDGSQWEVQPSRHLGIEDLDEAEILRTLREAVRRGRISDPGTSEVVQMLRGFDLIRNGNLLNAAVALFGRPDRLLPYYPQCLLRMARFRGTSKSEFLDNRQEFGNAFTLLIRAQQFMQSHLPIAGRIVPGIFERVDEPLYPPEALREAVANALCHRDYGAGGASIGVAIYDDRLEVSSTGTLHFGLTVEDLLRTHSSRPWNTLIAQVFHRRGIIEQWGRGTNKIAELNEEAGIAPPEFEEVTGELVVRFRPTRYIPPTRVSRDLSLLQQDILRILAEEGPNPLSRILGLLPNATSERTVQDNLALLRQLGLVDLTGRARTARWMLKGVEAPSYPPELDL